MKLRHFATTWMELESIILNKVRKSEKDKYRRFRSFVEFKKQNKQIKNRLLNIENKLMVTGGEVGEGTGDTGGAD